MATYKDHPTHSLVKHFSNVKVFPQQAEKYGVLLVNPSLTLFKLTMKLQLQNKNKKQICSSCYMAFWKNKIKGEQKMRVHKTFKIEFIYEDYLDIKNITHRETMTHLKISAHRLRMKSR